MRDEGSTKTACYRVGCVVDLGGDYIPPDREVKPLSTIGPIGLLTLLLSKLYRASG